MEEVTAGRVASAPGRVVLLGEHVDHRGGTVLPVAVSLRTTVTYTPGGDGWALASEGHEPGGPWTRYVHAVLEELAARGDVELAPGRLEIESRVPEGKGLASSAALEVAVAGAVCDLSPFELMHACRKAENEGVGVPCGLMDQATAACAIGGHAMALDCSDGTFFHLEMPPSELLVFDSGIERNLADTPYAERLEEARTPGTAAARHVEAEQHRVDQGIDALERADLRTLGLLMTQCHASLSNDYRCSTPEIDDLVRELIGIPGVLGARLIGAGWGGTILALAEPGTMLDRGLRLVSDEGLDRRAP